MGFFLPLFRVESLDVYDCGGQCQVNTGYSFNIVFFKNILEYILDSGPSDGVYKAFFSLFVYVRRTARWQISHGQSWQSSEKTF